MSEIVTCLCLILTNLKRFSEMATEMYIFVRYDYHLTDLVDEVAALSFATQYAVSRF